MRTYQTYLSSTNRYLVPNIIQHLGQGYIIMNKEYKENIQNYIDTFDSDYVFIAQ